VEQAPAAQVASQAHAASQYVSSHAPTPVHCIVQGPLSQ
jgi:hypothetical protein